jgi:hypothetical protein
MHVKSKVPARRKVAKKKPTERVVGFVWTRVAIPETGESVLALVAAHPIDKAICRERQYRPGDMMLADLFKERNSRFYRLAHQLATFVRNNVDEFALERSSHKVLKALQVAARVECDEAEEDIDELLDLGSLGQHRITRHVQKWVPRSLNFTDMDDAQFAVVWEALCDYVAATYFPDWSQAQIEEAVEHWERDES